MIPINAVLGLGLILFFLGLFGVLFRKNLERMAIDPEDLCEQIRITLLHETGHFFGMSEDDLADVGLD